MNTPLKYPECTGWVMVTKDKLIDNSNACNYHIIEAKIVVNADNSRSVSAYNGKFKTCCGLEIKHDASYVSNTAFLKEESDNFRIFLAKKQNAGWEICGNCVRRFYKDVEQLNCR